MFIIICDVQVSSTGLGIQNWVPRPSVLALGTVAALHHIDQSPWLGTPLGYHVVDEQNYQGLESTSIDIATYVVAWKKHHILQTAVSTIFHGNIDVLMDLLC